MEPNTYMANNNAYRIPMALDDDLHLALTLSKSEIDVTPDPLEILDHFMDLFSKQNFIEAANVYDSGTDFSRSIIDTKLDEIPWRLSCEYFRDKERIHWINTWIQVGWFCPSDCEISPQLLKAQWIFSPGNEMPIGFNANNIRCITVEGRSNKFLHKFMRGNFVNGRINVEFLELGHNKYLIPIDVAFKDPKDPKHVFDLATVEFGSITPGSEHGFNVFRKPCDFPRDVTVYSTLNNTVLGGSSTTVKFFRGSAIGESFIPHEEKYDDEIVNPDQHE